MNYSHYTPGHLPLSTENCHGEKITFISYISHWPTFSLPKMKSYFLACSSNIFNEP